MIGYVTGALLAMTILEAAPDQVSFPTADSGIVYADVYGTGDRGVVLAHGARFDKASWKPQAGELAQAGYRVVAIDFRSYGKSHGGTQARNTHDEMYLDVLAAVAYLRSHGASTVGVVGGSMGGGAAANAVVKGQPGQIDRLVLIAHAPVEAPERITGPKLFLVSEGDPIAPRVREQYDQAPEPKKLVVLSGSAHAQFLFTTDQGSRLMSDILQFLSTETGAVQ
jgi:pimeloyl-ACP methyl ester carboxylesterase